MMGFTAPAHGECEFCEGGTRYSELMESVEVLRGRDAGRRMAPATRSRYLPVVAEKNASADGGGCGSGGCSSCH
jgi:hypothetical protein